MVDQIEVQEILDRELAQAPIEAQDEEVDEIQDMLEMMRELDGEPWYPEESDDRYL